MVNDNQIKKMLDFDPLAEAEKITGVRHYSESENTKTLGLGLAMSHNERKQKVLDSLGDTRHGTPLEDYHRIFAQRDSKRSLNFHFIARNGVKMINCSCSLTAPRESCWFTIPFMEK